MQNHNWRPHPRPLGGPQVVFRYVTLAFRGFPSKAYKIRMGYLTPALSGPTNGRNCYVTLDSRGSPAKGTKSELATSPSASLGANKWAELLYNPCILGGPQHRQ